MNSIAFIFDMDGVIVDSNPFHKIALKQFCQKYGRDLSEDELREKIYGRRNQDWLKTIFGKLSPEKSKEYADEKEALFRKVYENDIKPLAGLTDFLKKLDEQGIPRAIGTSAPGDNVTFTLEKTGITRYFDIILDGTFVTHGKPHPEIYLKTADALGLKPKNCVVFEDSLAGVESARKAGCKVVGLTTTHSREELQETDWILDNFVGVDPKNMISQLFNKGVIL
ncbi:MAG: HAD family phosphatase [Cyclobacteriaceae bacterium]